MMYKGEGKGKGMESIRFWRTERERESRPKGWVGSAVKISVDAHVELLLYT